MNADRIAVVGLGLIGGSLAGALCSAGYDVTGYDINPEHAAGARARRLITRTAGSLAEASSSAAVLVLATPVPQTLSLLPQVERCAAPDALITDCGSVKRPVVARMAGLTRPERAVGGHPIAGRELSGPAGADPALFREHPWAVVPSARSGRDQVDRLATLVRAIGAVPVEVTPDEHDAILARTSHLPQIMASTLAGQMSPADARLAGTGLASMTRLAHSDPQLWRDILLANRDYVVASGRRFVAALEATLVALEGNDGIAVEAVLASARQAVAAPAEAAR